MHALLTFTASQASLELLRDTFQTFTYLPPSTPDRTQQIDNALEKAEVFITTASDLSALDSKRMPGSRLRVIQVGSAGVDAAFRADWVKALVDSGRVARNGEEWKESDDGSESS
jgi:phosphoglycerate dehydrogenase-like enzyme